MRVKPDQMGSYGRIRKSKEKWSGSDWRDVASVRWLSHWVVVAACMHIISIRMVPIVIRLPQRMLTRRNSQKSQICGSPAMPATGEPSKPTDLTSQTPPCQQFQWLLCTWTQDPHPRQTTHCQRYRYMMIAEAGLCPGVKLDYTGSTFQKYPWQLHELENLSFTAEYFTQNVVLYIQSKKCQQMPCWKGEIFSMYFSLNMRSEVNHLCKWASGLMLICNYELLLLFIWPIIQHCGT